MQTGWNPDAIAPPMRGGVYEREAEAASLMGQLARYAFVAATLAFAYFLLHL